MNKILEADIIKWTKGIKVSENSPISINNISTDSRTVKSGDFFIPIKGEKFDGNDYIEEVIANGAAGVITDRIIEDKKVLKKALVIKVECTNQAYLDIAEGYLKSMNMPVIGITGSTGKTTTKEMVYAVLSQKYKVLKTEGNYNNLIGLPMTVLNLDETYNMVILEMGMNSLGEIEKLSKVAKPDIAIITNIGESHIGNLGSKDGILQAKSEIFKYMKDNGIAILKGDDEYLKKIKINNKILYIGENDCNDCVCKDVKLVNNNYTELTINYNDESIKVKVNSVLDYIKYPVLIAFVAGKLCNLTNNEIIKGLESFKAPNKRYNIMNLSNEITLIDDCYNACLDSMISAIDTMIKIYSKRRNVVILGDIFELGSYSEKTHRELGEYLVKQPLEKVVLIGKDIKYTYEVLKETKDVIYFEEKQDAYNFLNEYISKGDVVLVKASHGNNFNEIVDYFKNKK